jgi:hypothetical protein
MRGKAMGSTSWAMKRSLNQRESGTHAEKGNTWLIHIPLGNTSKLILIDDNIVLRKDGNGTSLVTITKHPATHTKAMSKYVAPNLRGPKLVWVPSKSGWLFVGTMGIGDLVQVIFIVLIMWLSQILTSDGYYPSAMTRQWSPSATTYKCYNSSCGDLLELFDGLQIWELKACYGWSWANQSIFLVDHFIWVYTSWLNWINMQYCLLYDAWMDK